MQILKGRYAITVAGILLLVQAVSNVAEARECRALFTPIEGVATPAVGYEFARKPNDSENGFVTNLVPITAETILQGYARGIFPWEVTAEGNGVWFSPPNRGIMSVDLAIGKSDQKVLRKLEARVESGELRISFDEAFESVMRECAKQPRLRRDPRTLELLPQPSWITPEIIQGYTSLFKSGKAHSVEVWRGTELVGGMYGVLQNGVFTGESMFHRIDDVGKIAMVRLAAHLKSRGFQWMDTQIAPPGAHSLSVKWGAYEIPRAEFERLLEESKAAGLTW